MRTKKFYFSLVIVLILLVVLEIASRAFVATGKGPDAEAYLSMKQGEPRYLAEPFLNYINNSRFRNAEGVSEINEFGLKRLTPVAIEKPSDTYRILFVGGSTTYCMVKDIQNTFPAVLEESLNKRIALLNPAFKKVECLNAGLCGGTSAEILTHYLLKLKYLQPDLIVIHSGINDAVCYLPLMESQYHPDYHNRRNMFPDVKPLSPVLRPLLKSETFSLALYYSAYRKYVEGSLESNLFFNFDDKDQWLSFGNDSMYSKRYNAFYNNYKNLITVAAANKQKVLLVTEVIDESQIKDMDMPKDIRDVLYDGFNRNNAFLEAMSVELNTSFCRLDKKTFSHEMFPEDDFIHVNEKGEKLKAKFMEQSIVSIIDSTQQ